MYQTPDKEIGLLVVAEANKTTTWLLQSLQDTTLVELLGTCGHEHAKSHLKRLQPHAVLIDIDQNPEASFELLEFIGQTSAVPVLLWGQFSENNSEIFTRALRLGAIDFIRKPLSGQEEGFREELLKKVSLAGQLGNQSHRLQSRRQKQKINRSLAPQLIPGEFPKPTARLLLIGASTGGPQALQEIFSSLPILPLPTLIIQHMPSATLTESLAERLDGLSPMPVKESQAGELLKPGRVYIAKGDFHTELNAQLRVSLNQKPLHCSVRPSIDITLFSLLKHFPGEILTVILTGMGQDGLEGVQKLKQSGGRCLAEDKASCVVYGMPRMIVEHDLADAVVPIQQMAAEICHQLMHWSEPK